VDPHISNQLSRLPSRPPDKLQAAYLLPSPATGRKEHVRASQAERGSRIHGGGGRRFAEAVASAGAYPTDHPVMRRRRPTPRSQARRGAAGPAAGEARAGSGGPGEELVGTADAAAAAHAAAAQDRGRRQPAIRHLHPHRQCPCLALATCCSIARLYWILATHLVPFCKFDGARPRFFRFVNFCLAQVYFWYPLNIITGGTTAKIMLAAKDNFLGKYIYKDTLARNLAAVIYKVINDQAPALCFIVLVLA